MLCPSCHAENRGDRRFCLKCGTPLTRVCAACRFTNEPAAEFCGGCGAPLETTAPAAALTPDAYTPKHLADKILTSKTALEGERKQITVLFADLKGSMELLADRDPEEARTILDAVVERMMEAVHRYEGTVNLVMGDGIMALFGAPVAHEDHAARASYAALRMQESVKRYAEEARHAHGVSVQIRVGLNSGEVVVRAIGSDLRMDYTAIGQNTHLAARMEQLATPGSIVITPATLALVEGLVAVTSLGFVPVKGVADPLEVFEVTGMGAARTRLHAAARRGLTRFVGRDSELEQLWRAQELAAQSRGQVAALVGEAGVGKSRLVYEFTHSHRMQGWLVLEAASVSYGKATSYLPVIALLKGYFKIQDRDDRREIREKVTGKLLALDRELEPILPALLALLDVPVDDSAWQAIGPEQRRRQTLDGVKRLLLREALEQPLLVIFEDLHWIDGETQALLDGLVESLGSARLFLLVNYRPDYQHAWTGKTFYCQLLLDALPPAGTAELLDDLLGDDLSLAPLKQLLVKRGNPFFVEESVRTLVETKALTGDRGQYRLVLPITAIQIAPTVQVTLAARIDRLPSEEKRILQIASVIGKDVPFLLLREVANEPEEQLRARLAHLQIAEFLHETMLFPDLEYSFKHALTHEVTYRGLLQDRRKILHARIVGAIERLYAHRLTEHVERLAHHAVQGEMWEQAADYFRKAGAKAYARGALSDALKRYQEALDLLSKLPATPENIRHSIDVRLEVHAPLLGLGELQRTTELHQQAGDLARQLEDRPRLGRIAARMANLAWLDTRYSTAIELAQEALRIATTDDPDVRAETIDVRINATHILGLTHLALGQYQTSREYLRQNVEGSAAPVARQNTGFTIPPYVFGCGLLAWGSALLGDFEAALTYGRRGVDEADASGSFHAQAAATTYLALALVYRGQHEAALPWCERGLRLSETSGVGFWRAIAHSIWGSALAGSGDPVQGLPHLEQGAVLQESAGIKAIRSSFWIRWGEALLLNGDVLEARRVASRSLELAATSGERGFEAEAHCVLARTVAEGHAPEMEAARLHYERALALAAELDMRPLVAHCHLGLGRLYRRTGNQEQAREHLTTATTMYREMDMQFWLEQAEAGRDA